MEFKPFENPWIKKIRFLTGILVVSAAVNVGLITSVVYVSLSKRKMQQWENHPQVYKKTMTNAKVLSAYFDLSFADLLQELNNKTLVQDGYMMRDLALACLVNFHYFDIDKAVSGSKLQHRKMAFIHQSGGEMFELEVFPGLSEKEFQMIQAFSLRSKWPLTSEGLYLELQKEQQERDPTLVEAFQTTPEFYALFTALNRGEEKISHDMLLRLILEGSWAAVEEFASQRRVQPDQLAEHVRGFLKACLSFDSKTAASFWLKLEGESLVRELDDISLLRVIHCIQEDNPVVQKVLKKILCSPRSDQVRIEAGLKLYALANLPPPAPYDQAVALKQFLPSYSNREEVRPEVIKTPDPKEKRYTVQSGDSLWKISRKYRVGIEELRQDNKLKSDQLRPGQELIIRGL